LGLTHVHFQKDRVCSACQTGKQVGTHHPHKNIMAIDRPLELLHMDLFGPIAYISIGGSKYCLVIVDDYSRFTWVFFLQEKYQTQETLKGFLRRAQNEFGLRIKKIRSDNGTEFKNSQIEGYLEDEGIKHEFSLWRNSPNYSSLSTQVAPLRAATHLNRNNRQSLGSSPIKPLIQDRIPLAHLKVRHREIQ
jgi:transposase InsO family protein